jgi:hypothetical protein
MATLTRVIRLFAAVAAFGIAGTFAVSAQSSTPMPIKSVSNLSVSRPGFTRPGGIPGSARSIAANEQYLLAPAQPSDPAAPNKRKKH